MICPNYSRKNITILFLPPPCTSLVNKLNSPIRMITYVKIFIELLSLKDTNSCSLVWQQVNGEPDILCVIKIIKSLTFVEINRPEA